LYQLARYHRERREFALACLFARQAVAIPRPADLLFVDVTPLMWVGPVENWVSGLNRIVELGPRIVVPGHGPPTTIGEERRSNPFLAG